MTCYSSYVPLYPMCVCVCVCVYVCMCVYVCVSDMVRMITFNPSVLYL